MIDQMAEAIAGPSWEAMSAVERDRIRIGLKQRLSALPVTVDMVVAGLASFQGTHMRWETDETRVIEIFKEMWAEAMK